MKIGIIGDAHFRPYLRYAEYTPDRREQEKKAVLDTIVDAFTDCDTIVFMGDNFDVKNNPSSVIKDFTNFVERFEGKEVYILAGNHEKSADGRTAIDYLKEIKNPKWHIITKTIEAINGMVFCPYFFKEELDCKTPEEATAKVLEGLPGGDILFCHHAIADTLTISGQSTTLFPEVVLPRSIIEQKFKAAVGGHIHKPGVYGNKILVTGCVFSNEVGDVEKFAWKIDTDNLGQDVSPFEQYPLPIRPIVKIVNPRPEHLEGDAIKNPHRIVKIEVSDPALKPFIIQIKEIARKFDAYILIEQYPNERKKMDVEQGAIMDYSVEQLLMLYAKQKKVDEVKLLNAWEIVKV